MPPTPGHVAHFAINVDDMDGAQEFYASAFGWQFTAWGPPGFFQITTADGELPGPIGAIQGRRVLDADLPQAGFECTVAVDDLGPVLETARRTGRVVMEPAVIPGVGELAFVADPSGNIVGAMVYET